MAELGYDASVTLIESKLRNFAPSEADRVFVAEHHKRLIGVISCHVTPLFHQRGNIGRITALVVDADSRGNGTGKSLIATAEQFLVESDCIRLEVTSGDHRKEAHEFYKHCGYLPDERRFIKHC